MHISSAELAAEPRVTVEDAGATVKSVVWTSLTPFLKTLTESPVLEATGNTVVLLV